ncbi:MAG: 6-phosphogluconolactonase [Acidimicrobiales bacterium]
MTDVGRSTMVSDLHRLEIVTEGQCAERAADLVGRTIETAVHRRGQALLVVGVGPGHRPIVRALADQDLPWGKVIVIPAVLSVPAVVPTPAEPSAAGPVAVAEPAPAWTGLDSLPVTWLPLPVAELAHGPDGGAPQAVERVLGETIDRFGQQLRLLADDPPIVDVALLDVTGDGSVAGLCPGDPALDELRRPLAVTGPPSGPRRLTLTRPVFDRCRRVVWVSCGADQSPVLARLLAGDLTMPAGMIRPRSSVVVADTAAARQP